MKKILYTKVSVPALVGMLLAALASLSNGQIFDPAVVYDAGDQPRTVVASDLDGDGDPDLAVTDINSDSVSVLLNEGNGTFVFGVNFATGVAPVSVAASDLNGDGSADLAVTNEGDNNVSIFFNNGDGTFVFDANYAVGAYPFSVAASDLDGDGDQDLAVANLFGESISVLFNNGDGTFVFVAEHAVVDQPVFVATSDLEGDGDSDLLVINGNNVSVLLNNGDGSFASSVNYAVGHYLQCVAPSDLDRDGDPDLAVADNCSCPKDLFVLFNKGNGTFDLPVSYTVENAIRFVVASDLDGDGDTDLATADGTTWNVIVLLNNGDGSFVLHSSYPLNAHSPASMVASDLDLDGDIDLVVANSWTNNVSVLLNRLGPFGITCTTFDDLDQTISQAKIDNNGVRKSLQAKANNARRQYERENLKSCGNILCALLHEVGAQDSKHIDQASAQDIRDCVTTLAANLGIPLPCLKKKELHQPDTGPLASLGDSIWSFYFTGDQGLFGVEFDGDYFYVTGDNYGGDSNMIYVFDRNGKYVREFAQKSRNFDLTDWGWLDLAYRPDHEYFFGSDDSMITAFDESGNVLYEFRGPYDPNIGLAWDGQYVWVSHHTEPLAKIDTTGVVVASYSNSYWVNGLAWDDASRDNPWLWVSAIGGPWGNRIYQFDPGQGQYTGVYFEGAYMTGPGGLAFASDWDSSRAIAFQVCQLMPDYVVAYDLGPLETILNATVDIKPEVLNLKSKGKWVTCYIELPEGYSPEEIDRPTVTIAKIDEEVLNPPIRTEGPSNIGDYDGDSIPDLMVKFSRQELISHLQGKYGVVTILVSGELHNGAEFEGSDTLTVIDPPQSNRSTMVQGNRSAYTFQLYQSRPSPFSTSTRISYQLPEALPVRLAVYDVRGRLVKALVVESQSPPGPYTVEWRGDDDYGHSAPAGIYLYRLDAGRWSATRKTILLR